MKSGVLGAILTGVALGGSACANETVTPTPGPATKPVAIETFAGTLPKEGSRFYSFTVAQSGTVSIMLLGLVENGAPSTATVLLTLGVPRATDCIGTSSVVVGVGVGPQLSLALDPLIYCARIADIGNLTAPTAAFSINIVRPR